MTLETRMTDRELFSNTLKALCLTRDYVGEELLPAIPGWEWYDIGLAIAGRIPDDEWAEQFRLRVEPSLRKHENTVEAWFEKQTGCIPNGDG